MPAASPRPTGTLYLVATPLGNLEDLTFRAARVLDEVDLIAAEDTRRARVLLAHYGVGKPLRSLHGDSLPGRIAEIVRLLREGQSVAYLSDAGSPGLSDPGAELVQAAREAEATVTPLPGPCAPAAAFSVAGLAAPGFVFPGFVPRASGARREFLRRWLAQELPVVLFEAPHRISDTLDDLAELAPQRQVIICREMTKQFEQVAAGPAGEWRSLLSEEQRRGEFTLVVAGAEAAGTPAPAPAAEEIAAALTLMQKEGLPRKSIARVLQLLTGLSRNEAYRRAGDSPAEPGERGPQE